MVVKRGRQAGQQIPRLRLGMKRGRSESGDQRTIAPDADAGPVMGSVARSMPLTPARHPRSCAETRSGH